MRGRNSNFKKKHFKGLKSSWIDDEVLHSCGSPQEGVFHLGGLRAPILNMAGNSPVLNETGGLNTAARLTRGLGTFQFCGVNRVDQQILDNVKSDEAARKRFLQEVKGLWRSG